MPARAQDQLALDEQVIEDADIEAALEERQRAKEALVGPTKIYQGAKERAAGEIAKLELPDGGAARVGRFRITREAIDARTVTFETKASSRVRISLADEAPEAEDDDDADLRPKGPVDVRAIRNAADADSGRGKRSRRSNGDEAAGHTYADSDLLPAP